MRIDIRFAGITLKWSHEYARSYSEKLQEMGFFAKPIYEDEIAIVAYSHRPFSRSEVLGVLEKMKE